MKRFEVNATPILKCKRQHILRKNGIFFYFPFEKINPSRIDTHASIERIQFFKYNHAKKLDTVKSIQAKTTKINGKK